MVMTVEERATPHLSHMVSEALRAGTAQGTEALGKIFDDSDHGGREEFSRPYQILRKES